MGDGSVLEAEHGLPPSPRQAMEDREAPRKKGEQGDFLLAYYYKHSFLDYINRRYE